jgi:hypothetical protein
LAFWARCPRQRGVGYDSDYPLVGYADRPTHDAIARFQESLDRGETHRRRDWRLERAAGWD